MANYLVTSTVDSGDAGTLRAAIAFANANPGTTITFDAAIAGQTITLTSELPLILGEVRSDGAELRYAYGPEGVTAQQTISNTTTMLSISRKRAR